MTRQAGFKLNATDHGGKSVGFEKLRAIIMGRVVEPTRNLVKAVGSALQTGSNRVLQAASNFSVQTGEYLQKQAFAFANIAGQNCPAPKPT